MLCAAGGGLGRGGAGGGGGGGGFALEVVVARGCSLCCLCLLLLALLLVVLLRAGLLRAGGGCGCRPGLTGRLCGLLGLRLWPGGRVEGLEEGLCVVDALAAKGDGVGHEIGRVGAGAEGEILGREEGHWAAEGFAVKDVEVRGEGGLLKVGGPVAARGELEGGGREDGGDGRAAGRGRVCAEVGLGVVEGERGELRGALLEMKC